MAVNHTSDNYLNRSNKGRIRAEGVYMGIVMDNFDSHKEGRLSVYIPELCAKQDDASQWIRVNYASPFAGSTNIEDTKTQDDAASSQTSYGFWAVPPDIGNLVLIVFVNNDMFRGYWFACAYHKFMNHMVPGVAINLSTQDSVNSTALPPVVEYNKKNVGKDGTGSVKNVFDPKRPLFDSLYQSLCIQGLNTDPERGGSTTSARRESPSKVFGFLTPRSNGWSIDDDTTNEFFRIRTRSGVQFVVHETTGYVYMCSKNGNSWVEISDEGVDVYSIHNISFRSEENINFYANKNIIMEGQAIHSKATNFTQHSTGRIKTVADGEIHTTGAKIFSNSTDEAAQADNQSGNTSSSNGPGTATGLSVSNPAQINTGNLAASYGGSPIVWQMPVIFGRINDIPGTPRDNGTLYHAGYDIGSYVGNDVPGGRLSIAGANIYPTAAGVITLLVPGLDGNVGGRRVSVQHTDGTTSTYMHMVSTNPLLSVGQEIDLTTILGQVGGSGAIGDNDYIPHLHYERRDSMNNVIAPFGTNALSGASASDGPVLSELMPLHNSWNNTPGPIDPWTALGFSPLPPSGYSATSTGQSGSAQGSQTGLAKVDNDTLINSKNPLTPVDLADVDSSPALKAQQSSTFSFDGVYKEKKTQSIVTRLVSHEPFKGHPKTMQPDRKGASSASDNVPRGDTGMDLNDESNTGDDSISSGGSQTADTPLFTGIFPSGISTSGLTGNELASSSGVAVAPAPFSAISLNPSGS